MFQSSFELTGYITSSAVSLGVNALMFQSSFELTGYITMSIEGVMHYAINSFKALSSLRVI